MGSKDAKIKLYTNHRCPWAHRAHIILSELQLPFEEVIIDLDKPREPWYLEVNPRGLVPTLSYNGEIIPESGIVAQFLADAHPSRLLPQSSDEGGPLKRARIAFFVDAFFSKFQNQVHKLYGAKTEDEVKTIVDGTIAGLLKEVEPLLKDAKPFFGGSQTLTFAEVLTASFAIRFRTLATSDVDPGLTKLGEEVTVKAPNFWKWVQAVSVHPSVTNIYSEEKTISGAKTRLAKARATA